MVLMRYIYKYCFVFFLIIISGKIWAQQFPQYSQYLLNDFAVNPAVAGSNSFYEVKINQRNQWVGITDAPRTLILTLNGPFKTKNVGLGGTIYSDVVGPTRRSGSNFNYAYHLKIQKGLKLSLSLTAGIMQFSIDGSKVTTRDPGDTYFANQFLSSIVPGFGFSAYLYHDDYFFGLSAPQLTQKKVSFFTVDHKLNALTPAYFITGGYRFKIGDDFKIEPSVLAKYSNPAPMQFDFNTRVVYKDQVWLGSTIRIKDSFTGLIGFVFQQNLLVGYSYDYTFSGLRKYSSGTHEIMVGMRFVSNKKNDQSLIP